MTEAFARFVASESGPNEGWEDVHPLSRIAAHFWLSAFVREVERRAIMNCQQYGHDEGYGPTTPPCDYHLSEAFKDVTSELGLDSDKERP